MHSRARYLAVRFGQDVERPPDERLAPAQHRDRFSHPRGDVSQPHRSEGLHLRVGRQLPRSLIQFGPRAVRHHSPRRGPVGQQRADDPLCAAQALDRVRDFGDPRHATLAFLLLHAVADPQVVEVRLVAGRLVPNSQFPRGELVLRSAELAHPCIAASLHAGLSAGVEAPGRRPPNRHLKPLGVSAPDATAQHLLCSHYEAPKSRLRCRHPPMVPRCMPRERTTRYGANRGQAHRVIACPPIRTDQSMQQQYLLCIVVKWKVHPHWLSAGSFGTSRWRIRSQRFRWQIEV